MRAFIFGLLLLSVAQAASAQSVYRCKNPKGVVSLQSAPCAAGDKDVSPVAKAAAPATGTTAAVASTSVSPAPATSTVSTSTSTQPAPAATTTPATQASVDTSPQRCASAKNQRESALRQSKRKPSEQLLRQLDAEIRSACATQ